jgi:hypothetical protein
LREVVLKKRFFMFLSPLSFLKQAGRWVKTKQAGG